MNLIENVDKFEQIEVTEVVELGKKQIILATTHGELTIEWVNDYMVRIRLGQQENFDFGLINDYPPQEITYEEKEEDEEDKIICKFKKLKYYFWKKPFRVAIYIEDNKWLYPTLDGHFTRRFRIPPFGRYKNNTVVSFDTDEDNFYGTGEQFSYLNLYGKLVTNYNEDSLGGNTAKSYKNIPLIWKVPLAAGLFFNTTAKVHHAVAYPQVSNRAHVSIIEDDLDLFIIAGLQPSHVINFYHELTGFPARLPDWTLKPWLSKAYYKDQKELITSAKTMKEKGFDCQTIVLDGRTWQDTKTRFAFEWDKSRYPKPEETIQQLKDLGYKICLWVYPYVSIHNAKYQELDKKGIFLKDDKGNTIIYKFPEEAFGKDLSQLPESSIVDFTNEDAYEWWVENTQELIEMGIDAIKTDFGEQVPDNALAHNGVGGKKLHNVYTLLYNQATANAFVELGKDPVLWARSAWTGSQMYPGHWCGDSQSDWGGFKTAIRGCMQWILSGGAYTGSDIGGYYGGPPDERLYIRWMQFAALSPLMRFHGIGNREPYEFGEKTEKITKQFMEIRNEIMVHLLEESKDIPKGKPLIKPMIYCYQETCPNDPQSDLQFILGNNYFVAPVTSYSNICRFWLPQGKWQNFFDLDEIVEGPRWMRKKYPLDKLPLYIKREEDNKYWELD